MLKLKDIQVSSIEVGKFWPILLKNPASVITMHAEMAYRAVTSEEYAKEIGRSSIIIGDGVGFVLGMSLLGKKVNKTSGVDLVAELVSSKNDVPVFLWGGSQPVIEKAAEALHLKGLNVVGFHNGYSDEKEDMILKMINKSGAKVVLVGIGGRVKQIELVNRINEELKITALTVGGVFDLLAGKSVRSPKLLQRIGLEWLWRMIIEPKRLRKLPLLIGFIILALKEKLFG